MRVVKREVAFGYKRTFIPYEEHNKSSNKIFYIVFVLLVLTNILTIIALFFSPDISRLINSQNSKIFTAYENRVAQLRVEVDRLYSRQYAQSGSLNLQLIELKQKQSELAEIQPYIKALAQRASILGVVVGNTEINSPVTESNSFQNTPIDNIVTGSIHVVENNNKAQIIALEGSISQLASESRLALKRLTEVANRSTNEIVAELKSIGYAPDLSFFDKNAVGGPFIPSNEHGKSYNLLDSANDLVNSLDRLKIAKRNLQTLPILMPLSGKYRLSSPYGNRTDPFGRQKAFHSGMDFAAPRGNIVSSAGAGIVIHSGRKGNYGIAVEVKHANGLVTRYAHLSATLVKVGQSVDLGDPIAKVGSTGRSTGPHLHFEIRRADKTLNPQNFINVGKKLSSYI
ncbi:MAG: M23 family metallopeptidase [Devosiaceae bacterium]|nr:M23 family metallopeptidase [Devosiaceae bacterium]